MVPVPIESPLSHEKMLTNAPGPRFHSPRSTCAVLAGLL